jgi:pheromone shutdown protein TraB
MYHARCSNLFSADRGAGSSQVALEEAAACGASQVLLIDRPNFVTQRRLAQGVWGALAPRFFAGLGVFNAAIFGGALGAVDTPLATNTAAVSLVATLAALAPVALPYLEAWRFSRMTADEIEAAVRVPEPIESNLDKRMKLWGEDALLDWPGAEESIIRERDDYMARTLAATAVGARLCELVHAYHQHAPATRHSRCSRNTLPSGAVT